jgi:hypothetical protein
MDHIFGSSTHKCPYDTLLIGNLLLEELPDYIVAEDCSLITMKVVPATFSATSGTSHQSTQHNNPGDCCLQCGGKW